jgi:hypothetical protein
MPEIAVGPFSFKSKAALEIFEKDTMARIPFTDSLRGCVSHDIFAFYYELVQRHPDAHRKLIGGINDFKVVPSVRDMHSKELQIIHLDGISSSISRKKCVTQRAETFHACLRGAFRSAVDEQIREYGLSNHVCAHCGANAETGDIDHILPFTILVRTFCEGRSDIPTLIGKKEETNQYCFTDADSAFSIAWQTYHRDHATLRRLCKSCHVRRGEWE